MNEDWLTVEKTAPFKFFNKGNSIVDGYIQWNNGNSAPECKFRWKPYIESISINILNGIVVLAFWIDKHAHRRCCSHKRYFDFLIDSARRTHIKSTTRNGLLKVWVLNKQWLLESLKFRIARLCNQLTLKIRFSQIHELSRELHCFILKRF